MAQKSRESEDEQERWKGWLVIVPPSQDWQLNWTESASHSNGHEGDPQVHWWALGVTPRSRPGCIGTNYWLHPWPGPNCTPQDRNPPSPSSTVRFRCRQDMQKHSLFPVLVAGWDMHSPVDVFWTYSIFWHILWRLTFVKSVRKSIDNWDHGLYRFLSG